MASCCRVIVSRSRVIASCCCIMTSCCSVILSHSRVIVSRCYVIVSCSYIIVCRSRVMSCRYRVIAYQPNAKASTLSGRTSHHATKTCQRAFLSTAQKHFSGRHERNHSVLKLLSVTKDKITFTEMKQCTAANTCLLSCLQFGILKQIIYF